MPVAIDVFISYARGDEAEWVREKLYEPLLRRRTRTGRRPEIFFDTSVECGIGVGADWRETLSEKMKAARNVVPVFSNVYFTRPVCRSELNWAMSLRDQRRMPILPLMLEPCRDAPLWAMELQAASISDPHWFERLCAALELTETAERRRLAIESHWGPTQVNRTLPRIDVRVLNEEDKPAGRSGEIVRLVCAGSVLQGPARAQIVDGVASFDGVSLSEASDSVVLTAQADGAESASGPPFAVASAATAAPAPSATVNRSIAEDDRAAPSEGALIPATGLPAFLNDERSLAVLGERTAAIFDISGHAIPGAEVAVKGRRPRLEPGNAVCAVVDWPDRVCLLSVDGRAAEKVFSQNWGLSVVGDVVVREAEALVGLWSGEVARLALEGPCETLFRHPGGVQALAADGDSVYVYDLEGEISLYRSGERVRSLAVERKVRALTVLPKSLVAVCENGFYQMPRDLSTRFAEATDVAPVASALGAFGLSVAIGASGKGARIDAELNPRASFYAAPGAVPLSSDRQGRYCVLANGDGTFTLLASDGAGGARIVYTHTGGGMAVSPSGSLLAVSERTAVRLVDPASLAPA